MLWLNWPTPINKLIDRYDLFWVETDKVEKILIFYNLYRFYVKPTCHFLLMKKFHFSAIINLSGF